MQRCNCNEKCFYVRKVISSNIDGQEYIEYYDINKCNRLLSDNTRKKPCDYNSAILVESKKKTIHIENISILNETMNKNDNNLKLLTVNHVKNTINKMLKFYFTKSTNYFGNLNFHMKLLGYSIHDPRKETLKELKIRLSKPPKDITKIYLNKDVGIMQTLCETDYDYENEQKMLKRIKDGYDPLEWTKDTDIQSILNKRRIIHKKHRNNKKEKTKGTYEEQVKVLDLDEEEEKDQDQDQDEDEEEEGEESKNLKDNEFDIEENSDNDDDFENNDYDDFSD